MCCQLPVDTSIISPVGPMGSGVGSGAPNPTPPSQPPMTYDPATTTTTTEIPNYLAQTPVPPTQTPQAGTVSPPVTAMPSVQVIFDQLKSSNVLLSDINLKPPPDTSPLAHLQPHQLASAGPSLQPASTTPVPGLTPTSMPNPHAIQLASTAPVTHTPNGNNVANYEESKPHGFMYGIIVGLGAVILLVGGMFAYQYLSYEVAKESSTSPIVKGYDALLDALPFINHESEDTVPEAAWYQED